MKVSKMLVVSSHSSHGIAGNKSLCSFAYFQSVKMVVVGLLLVVTPLFCPAYAQTLDEVLAQVYKTNPDLIAERHVVKASRESIKIAKGERLPHAEASGTVGAIRTEIGGIETDGFDEAYSAGATVTQAVYTGGRINAAISAATEASEAASAQMEVKEQSVFMEAITAYMDVIRDKPILEVRRRNVSILRRRLSQVQDFKTVGRATLTDVKQAEARIASAMAQEIQAQGNLRASRSAFERVTGLVPAALEAPKDVQGLPMTEIESVEWAESHAPAIQAAQYAAQAAASNVKYEEGALRPEVGVEGFALYGRSTVFNSGIASLLSLDKDFSAVGAVVRVRIPLFQGGIISAKTRRAEALASQQEIKVVSARRYTRDAAVSAWQAFETARYVIQAREAQIAAAELALDGVVAENKIGRRTALDVLDAEQELFNAQVMKIKAERDWLVASYAVLASVGRLTSKNLKILKAESSPPLGEQNL